MITQDWKNAEPKTLNAWKALEALIAISTITPFYFNGVIAGSEFLTYAATKMYFSLNTKFGGNVAAGATVPVIVLYDESNTLVYCGGHPSATYTGAAVNYANVQFELDDIFFSRLVANVYANIIFNGYRITY